MLWLDYIIVLYVVFTLTNLVVQLVLATLNLWKQTDEWEDMEEYTEFLIYAHRWPKISVVMPVFSESPKVLESALQALESAQQKVPGLEILVVDDGSVNFSQLYPIYKKYQDLPQWQVFFQANEGKRVAQLQAFSNLNGEVVLTIDSDTLVEAQGIFRLVGYLWSHPRVGAASGDIRVSNRRDNWLSGILSLRYWLANNLERAAQSFTGTVLCMSGPFSAYRRQIIEQVKDSYVNQTFLGKQATFGDDRHLTNLVLKQGWRTAFVTGAMAYTQVPTKLAKFVNQQLRWSKSFLRELIINYSFFWKLSWYSLWDYSSQFLLSLVFLIAVSRSLAMWLVTGEGQVLLWYLLLLAMVAEIRAMYGVLRTGRLEFVKYPVYSLFYISFLIPVKLRAMLELGNMQWGTRGKSQTSELYRLAVNFFWMSAYVCILVTLAGLHWPEVQSLAKAGELQLNLFQSWSYFMQNYWLLLVVPLVSLLFLFTMQALWWGYHEFHRKFRLKPIVVLGLLLLVMGGLSGQRLVVDQAQVAGKSGVSVSQEKTDSQDSNSATPTYEKSRRVQDCVQGLWQEKSVRGCEED